MEYYGLRKCGSDIDLIISDKDYQILAQKHPGCRIDLRLPDMSGVECSVKLRKSATVKSCVIVYLFIDWIDVEANTHDTAIAGFLLRPLPPSMAAKTISACKGAENMAEREASPGIDDDSSAHTVLLAEDAAMNREIVLELLEPTSLNIDCAKNGNENPRYGRFACKGYTDNRNDCKCFLQGHRSLHCNLHKRPHCIAA